MFGGQYMMQCLLYEGDLIRLVFLRGPLWLLCRELIRGKQSQRLEHSSEAPAVTDVVTKQKDKNETRGK